MFLSKKMNLLILCLCVCVASDLLGGVYTKQGHSVNSYENDIEILKKKIAKSPQDAELRADIIHFYMILEKFDETVDECEFYFQNFPENSRRREVHYNYILALAGLSRYSDASLEIDKFISRYNIGGKEKALLNKKKGLYAIAVETGENVNGGKLLYTGNAVIVGYYPQSETYIGVDRKEKKLVAFNKNGEPEVLPDLPEIKNPEKLISIAFNSSTTRAAASFTDFFGSHIAIAEKKAYTWSGWEKYGQLNQGSVNSYPSFGKSGNLLLFVSSRNKSTGLDLFSSRFTGGEWKDVKSINKLNSAKDEASVNYVPERGLLLFSSNGYGSKGGFDLYKASVSESEFGVTVSDVVHLTNMNTYKNEVYPPYPVSNGDDYLLNSISASTNTLYYMTDKSQVAIPKEGSFVASSIYFDLESARLRSSSYSFLQKLYQYMIDNPQKKIKISGHTDNSGKEAYNNKLSLQRAQTIADFLISKGISKDRISVKGYGSVKSIASNETAEGRQKNRRVEIEIYE